jgi:3-phosphoshikimate 1-carboxyvinyltransferase
VTSLRIQPQRTPLVGLVPVPSDKSILHRALLLAALSNGPCTIHASSFGDDNERTLTALRQLGVEVHVQEGREKTITIRGRGLFGLSAPKEPLDCGNSGTSMRLLAGLLAGQTFSSQLIGDASLSKRPMARIVAPLSARGARISGTTTETAKGTELCAPLTFQGDEEQPPLQALVYDLPMASAQVKSALLLSGLYAHGVTRLSEPYLSRDHTERMLQHLGVPLRGVGNTVDLDPAGWSGSLPGFELKVPGDVSAAAFMMAAGLLVPGSRIGCKNVGINRTRTGMVDALRLGGVTLKVTPHGESLGEPVAEMFVQHAAIKTIDLAGELLVRSIDEVPALAVVAAVAEGDSHIKDAHELRAKESDRIAAIARLLRAFGVACEEAPDGMRIHGQGDARLVGGVTADSEGDHRIAMAACLLALRGDTASTVTNVDCIGTSFPRFVGTLRALGAVIDVV